MLLPDQCDGSAPVFGKRRKTGGERRKVANELPDRVLLFSTLPRADGNASVRIHGAVTLTAVFEVAPGRQPKCVEEQRMRITDTDAVGFTLKDPQRLPTAVDLQPENVKFNGTVGSFSKCDDMIQVMSTLGFKSWPRSVRLLGTFVDGVFDHGVPVMMAPSDAVRRLGVVHGPPRVFEAGDVSCYGADNSAAGAKHLRVTSEQNTGGKSKHVFILRSFCMLGCCVGC